MAGGRWHSLKQDLSSILAHTRFPFSKINLCKHFMVTLCAYIVFEYYWVSSCWCMNMLLGVARLVEKVTRFLKPGTAISIGPTLQRQMDRKKVLNNTMFHLILGWNINTQKTKTKAGKQFSNLTELDRRPHTLG